MSKRQELIDEINSLPSNFIRADVIAAIIKRLPDDSVVSKWTINKILCFIGWHQWSWRLERDKPLSLSTPPPDHAKCKCCGVRYRKLTQG